MYLKKKTEGSKIELTTKKTILLLPNDMFVTSQNVIKRRVLDEESMAKLKGG